MTANNNIQHINLSDIQTSNYNPRKTFGDSDQIGRASCRERV